MLIGDIHVDITEGDYVFSYEEEDYSQYKRTIHELRCQGYRLVRITSDHLSTHYHYRRKGNKKIKIITVTMMVW